MAIHKLMTLSECIQHRYRSQRTIVINDIQAGKLPATYRLPSIEYFKKQITTLTPVYDAMTEKGWKPELIFVPKGLELTQWDQLMQGYDLGKGKDKLSRGTYRTWKGYELVGALPRSKQVWNLAVISAAERPVFTNVSKDGEHGPGAAHAVQELRSLPGMSSAMTAEQVIGYMSPSEDLYFALQLARLEARLLPVDSETWTMGKEDVKVVQGLGSLYFNYGEHHRLIRSVWNERAFFFEDDGIRPSFEVSE